LSFILFQFVVLFNKREDEGLYHLYFQACEDSSYEKAYPTSFNADFEESNYQNFLSSAELRLPAIFLLLSLCFGLAGILWAQIVQKRKRNSTQAHYFMAVLIFVKAFTLFTLAFNLKYIGNHGSPYWLLENFYNALKLAKTCLFYATVLIIYKKFSFISHTFKIVLILQFLATLSEIISLRTERGSLDYSTWRDMFILTDFLSCILMLLPALSFGEKLTEENENSTFVTKLKTYRRFYIVFVCYVFSSRIIL
jgi:Lung seven transmembrane receptor